MLKGRLVYLREYRKSDIALAHKYINDYEVRRMLVPGIPFPLRLEEEEKWYDSQSAFKDTYNFAVSKIENDEYIGDAASTRLTGRIGWQRSGFFSEGSSGTKGLERTQ